MSSYDALWVVGDIIVYQAAGTVDGNDVELAGLVINERYDSSLGDVVYNVLFYKNGNFDQNFQVEEKIARQMSFPLIGHVEPIDFGDPTELTVYQETVTTEEDDPFDDL